MELKDLVKESYFYDKSGMLFLGDCLDWMPGLPDKSIDMILCDLPYGTTRCKWDSVISLNSLWHEYKRIIKNKGAIVLTASQPFTSTLVMSNPDWFKYEWIWEKSKGSNFLSVKNQPLKVHESVLIFSENTTNYYPQKTDGKPYSGKGRAGKKGSNTDVYNKVDNPLFRRGSEDGKRFPRTVQYFATSESEGKQLHPTQKPIALFEYLMKTYTNENDIILDNSAGSCTTAIAAKKNNRKWICIEKELKYCEISKKRIQDYA